MIYRCNKFYHIILLVILLINVACAGSHNDSTSYTPTLVDADPILKDDSEYIIVLGDTQVYTFDSNYYLYYASTMDWIWSQVKHGKKIKCMLQAGDISESNLSKQYDIFFAMTFPTAELIPCIACIGNHDYSWDTKSKIINRYSTLFSQYTSFLTTTSKIVGQYERGYMDNIIVENYINGARYDIISLEFGPRPEVLKWVKSHIQLNPDIKYIMLTHEYLSFNNTRISNDSHAEMHFIGTNNAYSTPEQLWQDIIRDNDNIACVICGHNSFTGRLFTKNSADRNVAQSMFNLQFQPNGGDGWIQIWEFPHNNDLAKVITYNTITKQEDIDSYFEFKYKY